jgi:hypothetical protein
MNIVNNMNIVNTEVYLTPKQLLDTVSGLCIYRDVDRTSLVRWRKHLNMAEPPYTLDHARAIAFFADRLALGVKVATAKELTVQHLKETANV